MSNPTESKLPPNALTHWPSLAGEIGGRGLAVFLDYDGTLSPIAPRPELAILSEAMRGTLRRLGAAWPTTIVSGRSLRDVAALVGLEAVGYAGSHGFDIASPAQVGPGMQVASELIPVVAEAADELRRMIGAISGVLVEDKVLSVAVHYRLADASRIAEIERAVDEILAARPQLRRTVGKMVIELRPAIDWDKGRAVLWLLDRLPSRAENPVPVYVGDDVTDEDAFRVLRGPGIPVVVADAPRPTAALYSVRNVAEVQELLERLTLLRPAQT